MIKDADRTAPGSDLVRGVLGNRGFLACAAMLAIFAVAYQVLAEHKNIQFDKLRLDLRKPLDQLDRKKIAPYELIHPFVLRPEMVEELGTDQYVQWLLRDNSIPENVPEKLVSLFVTYYTGNPGQVPHVPDACYLGSGYRVTDESVREFRISIDGKDTTVPVRILEFERSALLGGHESKVVVYTFQANGQFCPGRRELQAVLANPLTRYAYFSKLELTFGTQEQMPPKDKAIAAAERCLQVLVPVLLKEHWPDWEGTVKAAAPAGTETRK